MQNTVSIHTEQVQDKRAKGGKRTYFRVLVTATQKHIGAYGQTVYTEEPVMGMKIKANDRTDFTNTDIDLDTKPYVSDIDGEYFVNLRKALADWYTAGKPEEYTHTW
jgi:hypothetical protein